MGAKIGDGESWTTGITGNPPFVFIGANPALLEHVLKTNFWKYEKGHKQRTTKRRDEKESRVHHSSWSSCGIAAVASLSPLLRSGAFFRQTLDVFLGNGIFNTDGKQWQKQRKVASHMFTARSLKEDMSAIFMKVATCARQNSEQATDEVECI
jgi:cytochrome P450